MERDRLYKEMEKIEIILENNNIWAETYPHNELPVICVEIHKGDWKHDHWCCDDILAEAGYVKMGEKTTWDDGSDCYSSVHYFA